MENSYFLSLRKAISIFSVFALLLVGERVFALHCADGSCGGGNWLRGDIGGGGNSGGSGGDDGGLASRAGGDNPYGKDSYMKVLDRDLDPEVAQLRKKAFQIISKYFGTEAGKVAAPDADLFLKDLFYFFSSRLDTSSKKPKLSDLDIRVIVEMSLDHFTASDQLASLLAFLWDELSFPMKIKILRSHQNGSRYPLKLSRELLKTSVRDAIKLAKLNTPYAPNSKMDPEITFLVAEALNEANQSGVAEELKEDLMKAHLYGEEGVFAVNLMAAFSSPHLDIDLGPKWGLLPKTGSERKKFLPWRFSAPQFNLDLVSAIQLSYGYPLAITSMGYPPSFNLKYVDVRLEDLDRLWPEAKIRFLYGIARMRKSLSLKERAMHSLRKILLLDDSKLHSIFFRAYIDYFLELERNLNQGEISFSELKKELKNFNFETLNTTIEFKN